MRRIIHTFILAFQFIILPHICQAKGDFLQIFRKKQPPGSRRINAPEAGRLFYFTYAVLSRHLHRVSLIFLISYSHIYLFLLCFSVLEELLGYSREQSVA